MKLFLEMFASIQYTRLSASKCISTVRLVAYNLTRLSCITVHNSRVYQIAARCHTNDEENIGFHGRASLGNGLIGYLLR